MRMRAKVINFLAVYIVLGAVFVFLTSDASYVIRNINDFRTRDIWRHSLFDLSGYVLTLWNLVLFHRVKEKSDEVGTRLLVLFLLQLLSLAAVIETLEGFLEHFVFEGETPSATLLFLAVYVLPPTLIFLLALYGSWRVTDESVSPSDATT